MDPNSNNGDQANNTGGYIVGYKKPPKNTQFQKGKSGCPAGRPRKTKNSLTDDLARLLDESVTDPDTRCKRIPRFQLVIRRHVVNAAKGDSKALTWLIRAMDIKEGEAPPTEPYWYVFSYEEALAAQGPEYYNEEFYQEQAKKVAQWTKELRTGATSIRGMIERELNRKGLITGDQPKKIAMRNLIVAHFIKGAAENPATLRLLMKLLPNKKFKRDFRRTEVARATPRELKYWPAPGTNWEEWEARGKKNL